MKKLLTLFTLLLTVCSGAWADNEVVVIGSQSSGDLTIPSNTHSVAGRSGGTNTNTVNAASDGQTASTGGSQMGKTSNIGSNLSGKAHVRFTVAAGEFVRFYYYQTGGSNKATSFATSDYSQSSEYYHAAKSYNAAAKNQLYFVDFEFADAGTYAISVTSGQTVNMVALKFDARPSAPISWSASSASAIIGGSNTFPTLTNNSGLTVSYASSTDAATINSSTGEITLKHCGTTTISATYTSPSEESTYRTTTKSYELTVSLAAQDDKFWKFSDTGWRTDPSSSSDETFPSSLTYKVNDDLEIVSATNSNKYRGVSNANTVDNIIFSQELTFSKISGTNNVLHFKIKPNVKITAFGRGNGTGDRYIYIAIGSTDDEGKQSVKFTNNTTPGKATYTYTGAVETDAYVYVSENTCNIFGVRVAPIHTVTYDLDGGTGTTPTETDKGKGDVFTLHDGTTDITAPDGKEFDGWRDGTSTYAGGAEYTMPDDDVILTAQWRTPAVKYHVTYELNGGTGTTPTETDKEEGDKFTLHDGVTDITAPDGKKFVAWNDGTKNYDGGALYTMPGDDVTLTAQWADKYTITKLSTTHGTIAVSATEAAAGEEITLTATPDFKYVLGSWIVYKTGDPNNTTNVSNNKFIMPAYDVTVDATFTADSRKQILYLRKTANENDDLYNSLKNNDDYVVTYEAPGSQTVTNYDLVVLHESLDGSLAESEGLIKSIATADVPILNTKSYFYNSNRWNWGTPDAGKSVKGATLNRAYTNTASHPIFEDVTIDDDFIEVVSEAASKAMQPVDPVSGKEGYLLATTPKGDGTALTAIHELTPAQRGAKSGKYLLISVSNAKLDDLSANGLKLFNNAVSYLLSNDQWVPTATVTIAEACTDGEGKYYGTYSNASAFVVPADLTVSAVGVSDGKLVVTNYDEGNVVKANTGVMVSSTTAGNHTILLSDETGTEKAGNLLKASGNAGIEAEAMETAAPGCVYYRLTMHNPNDENEIGFYWGAAGGAAFDLAANKAYLAVPESLAKEGFSFITGEEETDGIKAVSTNVENGVRYNLAGQKVGADYKGIVIVNGKKYLNK